MELCWESGGSWNYEREYCEYGEKDHVTPNTSGNERLVFEGYDPLMQEEVTIVRRGGVYFMDGHEMEELSHPKMPLEGLSVVVKDRIGPPSSYYLIRFCKIEVYVNCEFGPCNHLHSIANGCESR